MCVCTFQVLQLAQNNSKYKAIDRAIGKESFKVVTLLRLSPLLPLALSNYFYGITRYAAPNCQLFCARCLVAFRYPTPPPFLGRLKVAVGSFPRLRYL